MSATTLDRHEDKATTTEVSTAVPVKVFNLEGVSVDVPEEAGRTAQFYLDTAGATAGDGDVVYLNGQPVLPDTIVPVGKATHVITVSSEISNG